MHETENKSVPAPIYNDIYDKILNISRINKSGNTQKSYRYNLLDFVRFIASKKYITLPDDTSSHMSLVLSPLIQEGKLAFCDMVITYIEFLTVKKQAPRTITAKIAAIKNYVESMKAMDAIDWDISFIKGPKVEKSSVSGPSEKMFRTILNHVNSLWDSKIYIYRRNALMFYILVFCALRESEVLSIKIEEIDEDNRTIKTIKKGFTQPKTTRVPDNTFEKIQIFLKEDGRREGFLFISKSEITPSENKLERTTLWRVIKKICSDCGYKKLHPHSFRHFMVSEALEAAEHNTRLAMKVTGHKSEKVFNDYEDKRKDDQGILMNKIEQKWT